MYVYTKEDVQMWRGQDIDPPSWEKVEIRPHNFGRVPLIEYYCDRSRTSSLDNILDLQDSYNAIFSDNQDCEDAFANAMLVSKGGAFVDDFSSLSQDEKTANIKDTLKKDPIVNLGREGDLFYLTKPSNTANIEISLKLIERKIHQLTALPDFSDESFAGNASGVALQYKLFGTNLLANKYASAYNKGFVRRCKLYDAGMFNVSAKQDYTYQSQVDKIQIVYRMTEVNDPLTEAQAIVQWKSTEIVSDRTLMENASIIKDVEQEVMRMEEQKRVQMDREKEMYRDEFDISRNQDSTDTDMIDNEQA